MPGTARSDVFDPTTVGTYHCWNRLVRRAMLCGVDPYTKRDYSYRKRWVRNRLKELAGLMAVDVLDYAVLGNHLHTVLRNRPDIVESWSDEQVAQRWWRLCAKRRNADGSPAEPTEAEIHSWTADSAQMAELRSRLSDISWFMRLLCQPIARRANKEDEVTGRFFAQRFGCRRILDMAGLLTCSMYVDLNLVRANMALTPESSEFTSAYDRIMARWQRQQRKLQCGASAEASQASADADVDADAWLAPIFLDEQPATAAESCAAPETTANGACRSSVSSNPLGAPRTSDKGFLPIKLDEYLELLDWTGRQLRTDKPGAIPAHLSSILQRLNIRTQQWVDTVSNCGELFHTVIGRVEAARAAAARMGRRWLRGTSASALAFT